MRLEFAQSRLQPQPRRHQDLVVAAAASVHLAPGVAEPLDQARLDRGMAILVALVEDEGAAAEIGRQRVEFARQRRRFFRIEQADVGQSTDVRLARLDVVQEELAVEHDVVAGEEAHDAFVGTDSLFLPEQVTHKRLEESRLSSSPRTRDPF